MAIMKCHIPYFTDILGIKKFVKNPVLVFGYHSCRYENASDIPFNFRGSTFHDILTKNYGIDEIKILDLFDSRADLQIDMNNPVNKEWHEYFNTVIDVGSIEHVFDTKQCLWNLFSLVQTGGHLMIVTPCKGYFRHGIHTFCPNTFASAFQINGFDICYKTFSTLDGKRISEPNDETDVLIWIGAKKIKHVDKFTNPQQERWAKQYSSPTCL